MSLLDHRESIVHNRAVTPSRSKWIVMALLACWATAPAMAASLALHELEHHLPHLISVADLGQIVLHGHVQEDDADHHRHSATPASDTPSRLSGKNCLITRPAAMGSADPVRAAERGGWPSSPPDPYCLAPPLHSTLCVLQL